MPELPETASEAPGRQPRAESVQQQGAESDRQQRETAGGGPVIRARANRPRTKEAPWPGRIPRPYPALVLPRPLDAVVLDADGVLVGVSARLELTGGPRVVIVEDGPPAGIAGWAGPWPVDERWWDPAGVRRRARFQIGLADGRALLMFLAAGRWAVEAIYD
jgi:protein ImuB